MAGPPLRGCTRPSRPKSQPPGQTSGQRTGTFDRKTGPPQDPTRPAPPPLRSPHPPLRSVSQVSSLAELIGRRLRRFFTSGKNDRCPSVQILRRLRAAFRILGLCQVVFCAFFYARHHPTICCSLVRHRADIGSESVNRASVFPFALSATVTVCAFAGLLNALPRTARRLPPL